jgi:flavin-dependent dehydrogenase
MMEKPNLKQIIIKQCNIVFIRSKETSCEMKIAVMGMGVAGSYLMAILKNSEHEVTGYERSTQERHDSICAWGTTNQRLQSCKNQEDFNNYVIHDGKTHIEMNNEKFDIKLHDYGI